VPFTNSVGFDASSSTPTIEAQRRLTGTPQSISYWPGKPTVHTFGCPAPAISRPFDATTAQALSLPSISRVLNFTGSIVWLRIWLPLIATSA
jgi:hypothetical protein